MNLTTSTEEMAVGLLVEKLALLCNYSPDEAAQIAVASLLHDIGKEQIPSHIRNKQGKLTPAEFSVMKTHTELGYEALQSVKGELGLKAQDIARYHHETYDGTGYMGIPYRELPLYVAIVNICDVFVALIHDRPYKQAWTITGALSYIKSHAGTKFHPDLTDLFVLLIQREYHRLVALFSSEDLEEPELIFGEVAA